ncbi:hypothetical protein HZH66_012044 [Vespula vulgaris]|uniref:Uncharacterized protein n=1 Tax=Vespula vulgaris TaxID=7454 RepID=A0A834JAE6_VESVU|nr:hypothetical protein HZH66_012044 [Vespula vulgaris]
MLAKACKTTEEEKYGQAQVMRAPRSRQNLKYGELSKRCRIQAGPLPWCAVPTSTSTSMPTPTSTPTPTLMPMPRDQRISDIVHVPIIVKWERMDDA